MGTSSIERPRILIVEDDAISGKYLQQSLTEQKYDVPVVASSVDELLACIETIKPDLIIIDVMLKGSRDGIDAAEYIAARYAIPVIFMTAHTDRATLDRAKKTDPYAYLVKPINVSELRIAVEFALYRNQMERKLRRSEERYRHFFDLKIIGSAIVAPDGRWLAANERLCSMLGFDHDELLSKSWMDCVPPEYRESDDGPCLMAQKGGSPGSTQIRRFQRKDGMVIIVEVSAQMVMKDDGAIDYCVTLIQDITDRMRVQEILRESERKYRLLADNMLDLISMCDVNLNFTYISPSYGVVLGYSEEELIGKPFHCLTYADDAPGMEETIRRHMDDLTNAKMVFRMVHKDGYVLWVESNGKVLIDEAGKPAGVLFSTRDITGIKRIEMALRESEEKFRLLFEKSADAQLLIDQKRIIDCNMAAVSLLGAGKKEMLQGRGPDDLSPELQPDGSRSAQRMSEILKFAFELDNISFEWVHLAFDGRQVSVDATYTVIPIAGRLIIHAVLKDITVRKLAQGALRRSEQQYRVLVETMSDGLVQGDERGTITFVNDRFCEMVGYVKNEIIGSSILNFLFDEERDNFFMDLHGRHAMRERAYEMALKAKPGKKIDTIVSTNRLVDEQNHVAGFVAVFTDITDRKYLERRVLEISMKEQQRIGRDLHDDLGQILTGTGFLCESLVKKMVNRQLPEAEDARRIFALINEAKDHTRMLSRGLSPVEVDSGGIIAALGRFIRNVESVYAVTCELDCDEEISINDSMVETQFHYIVQESINNAIKHGKARHIAVSLHRKNGRVHLSVWDDGIGVPKEFDSLKGMGLRIMRYRANAIGASIRIMKNKGKGTTVSCSWRG